MSLRSVFFGTIAILCICSCNKELSFENGTLPPAGGSSSGTAVYTFVGGTGSCTNAAINGTYTSGVALTSANTMVLQVNVTTVGTYILSTSTANGILFSGSGTFTTTGVKAITLTGTGTPATTGAISLTVGSNGCTVALTVTGSAAGVAEFSLGGSPSACTGFTVAGTYLKGSALVTGNTVSFNVNVTAIGSYTISTNAVNGISFTKSGNFTTTGSQTVTLSGSGVPAAAGDFSYIVSNGAGTCSFTVTTGAAVAPAAGSLNCAAATATGTYTKGTALSAANTISIPVNVTTAGSYSITTAVVNGCSFSGSGILTAGNQVIVLTGSGTPAASGSNSYAVVLGTASCSFAINFLAGGVSPGNFLRCKIDGTLVNFDTNLTGYNLTPPSAGIPYSVSAQGVNSDVANSKEELWVTVQNPTAITTGIYNNGTISNTVTDRLCQTSFFPTGFPNLYWGSSALNAGTFSVNITSYAAHSAAGTFSGTLYESNGLGPKTKVITEGEFKISY